MNAINLAEYLYRQLKLNNTKRLAVIGGGGKSSLLNLLARQWRSASAHKLYTTTTRMKYLEAVDTVGKDNVLQAESYADFLHVCQGIEQEAFVYQQRAAEKVLGIPPLWIERLTESQPEMVVVYDADGSAGKPIKVHGVGEPQIAGNSFVVALVGLDVLERSVSSEWIHRFEVFRNKFGQYKGSTFSVSILLVILEEMFRHIKACDHIVLFNKLDSVERKEKLMLELAGSHTSYRKIVGSIANDEYFLL
jgi:probable selenium-dependent hydroxylase accessory protein YqeC